MNNLNSLIIEGNLVRDAQLKEPKAGFKVCEFQVAVNRFYLKDKGESAEEVSYFDVQAYGNYAETIVSKCKKGRGVRVVGRLKQDRWSDSNGKAASKVHIIAEHIEFKPIFNKQNSTENLNSIADANNAQVKEKSNSVNKEVETVF